MHHTVEASAEGARLAALLAKRTTGNPSYWDFSHLRKRQGSHGLFQYPAMMVPELQGALLDDVFTVLPDRPLVYDPFSGSGTVLVETLARGADFVGSDVNPMALLLMSVKAEPPALDAARHAVERVLSEGRSGQRIDLPAVPQIDKWFEPAVQDQLLSLRQGIRSIADQGIRRFLWVCLAETVRLTSNSRISTFKLHAYSEEARAKRSIDAAKTFERISKRNLNALRDDAVLPIERVGRQAAPLGVVPKVSLLAGPAETAWAEGLEPDVLMTSPPYGDNKTTVPYGQHSYLPLAWIDGDDVIGGIDPAVLSNTNDIDRRSLGGSLVGARDARPLIQEAAPSAALFADSLDKESLSKKVLAFSRDYVATLTTAASRLRPGAFCLLTLGERRVDNRPFPLVDTTAEILGTIGHETLAILERSLPVQRRIGPRNSEGATMAKEYVLVTKHQDTAAVGSRRSPDMLGSARTA